jgi:preprotein translocase subunit SecD
MLNRYPLWKNLLIVAVVFLGLVYALPNVFGEDPAVQVSAADRNVSIDQALLERVTGLLEQGGIEPKDVRLDERGLLARFRNPEDQLKAQDLIRDNLGRGYVTALNLAPSTPDWLTALGGKPMYLGLDLRGGVYFLMQVDMEAALRQADTRYVSDLRSLLRGEKVRYLTIQRDPKGGVEVKFRDPAMRDRAVEVVGDEFPGLLLNTEDRGGAYYLRTAISEQEKLETQRHALKQNITTLRKRVNELGVAEPIITQQGQDRVVVQLPGVQDTARAKEILGATATLEFRLVDFEHSVAEAVRGKVPVGSRLYYERDGTPQLLRKRVMLTGERIIDAASGIEQRSSTPAVFITLDSQGAKMMENATKDNIGKPMAVVFIETKVETKLVDGKPVRSKRKVEEVINVATIRDRLGKRFQVTGLDSPAEARDLALLLRAGSLAAPMEIVEERTVGPSLGQDNIDRGFESVVVGFVLVLIFMAVYYRLFGLVADLALTANLVLIVAIMSKLQATLTLPGIAGIVLVVGMAVDANVLIFERIREEIRNGVSPQAAINSGYEKAFSTIADANITTLIAAVVLFFLGTGPIKGFAVTLMIGIVTSMFTAIMGTRAVVNLIYGGRRVAGLSV